MATALREAGMGVKSRNFTLQRVGLSATESIALECLKQIASEGRVADQYEICAAIGSGNTNGGTVAGVVNRLVDKGFVERIGGPLQKGMWLKIVATGQITAEPRNKITHWRFRTDRVPSPAIQSVAQKAKPIAAMIEAEARLLGKSLSDFLSDLVYIGWHEYQAEKSE